jgi:hypothetical protein
VTITTSRLDEIDRKARAATPGPWSQYESMVCGPGESANNMDVADCALGSEPEDVEEWTAALRDAEHIAANSPDVTLQLVAISRAALAWSEARDACNADPDNIDRIIAHRDAFNALTAALGADS